MLDPVDIEDIKYENDWVTYLLANNGWWITVWASDQRRLNPKTAEI